MRGRGGSSTGGKRGDSSRDFTENGNADQVVPSGRPGRGSRGGRGGGGRGGGNRNFSNRQQSGTSLKTHDTLEVLFQTFQDNQK